MLKLTRQILIRASQDYVSRYIQNIHHLADYEQKVDTCGAAYPQPGYATAKVSGKFMGFSWKGVFEIRFTEDGGFTSRMSRGPLREMTGGFRLTRTHNGIILTHDENYSFPWFIKPIESIIAAWIASSMETELAIIKQSVEMQFAFSPIPIKTISKERELTAV